MTKKTDEDELLNSAQLAKMLGVSAPALRVSHSRGHIPRGVRLPGIGGYRWRRSVIERWIDEQRKAQGAA